MGYINVTRWRYLEPQPAQQVRDFHGAAMIADDGSEIPITESMVTSALESVHRAWQQANTSRSHR